MAIETPVPVLLEAARAFSYLSDRERSIVQTYLLARIAEEPIDPHQLLLNAQPFERFSNSQLLAIQTSLLCQLLA